MKLLAALALSGMTFVGATPASEASAPDRYLVAFKLSTNGASLGEPRLVVTGDEPAKIEIGKPDGSKFNMRFTVSPQENSTAKLASEIEISDGQGVISRASPTLVVPLGATGGFAFGAKSGWSATEINFTISKVDAAIKA